MNLISLLDISSFLFLLIALIVIAIRWKPGAPGEIKLLVLFLLVVECFHRFSNAMNWSGISGFLESYEPYFQLAIPLLYLFVFFGFVQFFQKRKLKETEKLFTDISEQIADIIYIVDLVGSVTYLSPSAKRVFQCPAEDIVNSKFIKLLSNKQDQHVFQNVLENMLGDSIGFSQTLTFKRPDGSGFVGEVNGTQLVQDGETCGMIGIIRDASERVAAEKALRESEERFRALSENSLDVIMRFDRDLRHLYVNPIVQKQTGIKKEDFIGKTHEELGFPEYLCKLWANAINKVFESGKSHRIEFVLPAGTSIDWLLIPELDAKGDVTVVMTSARDITQLKEAHSEKKKLEMQLQQAQKMEAIGRLAGGVAHDFNNLLTSIIGNIELVIPGVKNVSSEHEMLEEAKHSATLASELTRQLLAFSRKQIIKPRQLNLNDTVAGLEKMLRRLIGEDIELVTNLSDSKRLIKADPGQIEQVIINLVVNSRDVLPNGGRITMETQQVYFDETNTGSHIDAKPGAYALLVVSDNGPGIPKEHLSNIFDPFFTTKPEGKGTGLGLAMVYGIVSQHGGFVNVYSEPAMGTAFRVYFPFLNEDQQIVQVENSAIKAKPAGGDETILLVEDDPLVRKMAHRALARLGYHVLLAEDGQKALEMAMGYAGHIDMVLTDVVMPKMNGFEMVEELLKEYPDMKIIFTSGYSEKAMNHQVSLEQDFSFIQKPYSIAELGDKVRQVLET